jgi:elongation factor Ts
MEITATMVKELRERTGAGVLDCREALKTTNGDFDKAAGLLRQKGLAAAAKKVGRVAREGLIEPYIHPGARIGAMVELNCETDFVARTPEFRQLAHDLAMQVAAARPQYLSREDVPAELVGKQREAYRTQIADEGNTLAPDEAEAVVEARVNKFYTEVCLLEQPFIKDEGTTIHELIQSTIAKLGENIVVRRFARFELGE